MPAISPDRHLLSRLQRDWDRLARSPSALARARSWRLDGLPLRSLDDLLWRTGYGRGECTTRPVDPWRLRTGDAALRALVAIAREDELAARVVLQRLLPALSALARRRTRTVPAWVDATDELVSTAWVVIRQFPIERRTSFVVASLLHDIDNVVFRREARRKMDAVPTPEAVFELVPLADDEPGPAEELAELVDDACDAGLDPDDIDLVDRLADGATVDQIAAARAVHPRTVRNQRRRMVHRLRQLALTDVR
jgi:DNA-directed RNA polymerase specialized sigma24 family protein